MKNIDRRTKWMEFANQNVHPCLAWGGALRETSLEMIKKPDNGIKGVSLVAVGQEDLGEFAHTHWGRIPKGLELPGVFKEQARSLAQDVTDVPDWEDKMSESYENLKTRSCQQDLGLLVVAHSLSGSGSEAETALFGVSNESAILALRTMSERLLESRGINMPESGRLPAVA
jgi:hypothetical protein